MVAFIFLDANSVIDNPWALYASMVGALAAIVASLKYKAHKIGFYILAALCAIFGFLATYTQNNTAKIEAEKDMKINEELTILRVDNNTNKERLEQTILLKNECFKSDSLKKIEIDRLKDANKDLEREKKGLQKQLRWIQNETPNWRGTKAYNGVVPAQGRNQKWGYINKRGNVVYPYALKKACRIYYNRGGAQHANGKWGFIDSDGFVQVDFKYDDARHFEKTKDGYVARVLEDDTWYFVNKYGKKVRQLSASEMAGL